MQNTSILQVFSGYSFIFIIFIDCVSDFVNLFPAEGWVIRLYPTSVPIGKKKDIEKMIEEGKKPWKQHGIWYYKPYVI